jgi:hypothetical protein
MKKRATIIFLTFLLGGFGAKKGYDYYEKNLSNIAIYDYTGSNYTLVDSTKIVEKDFLKHGSKIYGTREFNNSICYYVYLHHLGVANTTSVPSVMRFHIAERDWPAIAYHIGIKENGDILLLNDLENISYHTGGNNSRGIGIVLWGDYDTRYPRKEQIETLQLILASLREVINICDVIPHRDARGANTECPGDAAVKTLKHFNIIK